MGEESAGEPRGEPQANQRLTVAQAADRLGITEGAVRSRIKRGTLPTVRKEGTVYVMWGGGTSEANQPPDAGEPSDRLRPEGSLVEALREQVAYLQGVIATRDRELALRAEEIRRRDSALEREQDLTAMFAERLRQLEAPASGATDEPQSPETAQEGEAGTEAPTKDKEQPRRSSWWRKFFGFE